MGEIDATEPVLLERCALRMFHMLIQGKNASYQIESDRTYRILWSMQIAFRAFHSFFVEVQANDGYICTGHMW